MHGADSWVEMKVKGASVESTARSKVSNCTPPQKLSGPDPTYTGTALMRHVQGCLVARCVITSEGTVRDCRVLEPLASLEMTESVIAALEHRRYTPMKCDGKPVDSDYPTGTTGILTNLHALGLDRFGAPVAVGTEGPYCTDDLGSPSDSFGDTHLLVTDLFPRGDGGCGGVGPGNPHRSTARDAFTPLAAEGTPKLVGAWRYLLSGSKEEDEQEELVQDE